MAQVCEFSRRGTGRCGTGVRQVAEGQVGAQGEGRVGLVSTLCPEPTGSPPLPRAASGLTLLG